MNNASKTGLHILLILTGIFIVFSGLDSALGGLLSMGWMESTSYFAVTNEHKYLEMDSHSRFLGGVWTGMGLLFLLAQTNLVKYQKELNYSFAIIFLGGIARFTQMNLDVTFGDEVLWAVVVELILVPIFYFWLAKVVQQIKLDQ